MERGFSGGAQSHFGERLRVYSVIRQTQHNIQDILYIHWIWCPLAHSGGGYRGPLAQMGGWHVVLEVTPNVNLIALAGQSQLRLVTH